MTHTTDWRKWITSEEAVLLLVAHSVKNRSKHRVWAKDWINVIRMRAAKRRARNDRQFAIYLPAMED